ncbi:disks large-associated protein 5 isoform X2 [Cheilinus undulatus]|uniref:disks large-associated protein 5 isoform X2 n=1 Tax=Cheilinus undulatus TaxID=241271 RepID=UPI001BD574A8|nr:disks large-associated protein 5 isoform X2 [Cheilinus undulatus]
MESRFAHLRQRDNSVSMLRVKMSRRRSQSQKENRDRAVNLRRQLDNVPEMDVSSLDASIAMANMSIIQEKTQNKTKLAKNTAVEERLKQLERWKERKALEKEKEKREKERKGVFKTGVYHHKDTFAIPSLPVVPAASSRAKETKLHAAASQSTRVTRSMKQQQEVQRPLKLQDPNASRRAQPAAEKSNRTRAAPAKPAPATTKTQVCAVEPMVRASRSANRPPVTAAPVVKDKPKDKPADTRTTRSRAIVNPVAPPSDRKRNYKAVNTTIQTAEPKEPEIQEPEEKPCPPSPAPHPEEEVEEGMVVDQAQADSAPAPVVEPVEAPSSATSFAPEGFVFQAPSGLSSFKFEPLTPRSADAFLTPSSSFNLPAAPSFNDEPQAEPSEPSPPKSPRRSPPHSSPTVAQSSPLESKHDVPYFRSEISSETNRLTSLCELWEQKVEDESIPEEMRDSIRTAVGQARLLMKERFKQFSGLVDDCEFVRGEKITTCTDLQGFWDMVYFQVEDVNKKFDALKEAESRGWVEEHKPAPRQRKAVKKPAAAPAKPSGTKAAARSRLAAAKAAMKAKQQAAEAEKAAKDAEEDEDKQSQKSQDPQPEAEAKAADTVVFDGGFFQVESPAKPPGSVRRSSRLSAAVLPQASPCSSYLSPRRVTRRSLALAQTPVQTAASPAKPTPTPTHFRLTLDQTPAPKSQRGTPRSSQNRTDSVNMSVGFTPIREAPSDVTQPETSPAHQSEAVSMQDSTATPMHPLPSITVVEEQEEPPEKVEFTLSLSPCETPLPVSKAPEPSSSSLSFTLSPCVTPCHPPTSFPPAVEAQESVCHSPESPVIEEIPGLDFERYLQPSNRCSVSPGVAVAEESLSPMPVDVEMESPRGQSEDMMTQQEQALPTVPSLVTPHTPQTQSAESELLLFTPDLKDRIRQSVCPSDLMMFTPPL